MKSLILFAAIVAAPSSIAQGFRCSAICVAFDAPGAVAYHLGEVSASGSRRYATAESLYAKAERECRDRAFEIGFYGDVALLDALFAEAYRYDETIRGYRRESRRSVRLGRKPADPKRAPVEVTDYDYWEVARRPRGPYGRPATRAHESYFHIRYWPASAKSACAVDSKIPDDETPVYEGGLPLLTD